MKPVKAYIKVGDKTKLMFLESVSGLTPGQACVIYDISDGHLLGGNFI